MLPCHEAAKPTLSGGIAPYPEDDPEPRIDSLELWSVHFHGFTWGEHPVRHLVIFVSLDFSAFALQSIFGDIIELGNAFAKDPFHTFFGLAGLSLIPSSVSDSGTPALQRMEPTLVLPLALLESTKAS